MSHRKPRLGFVGLGWIGQHRMKALLDDGTCEVAAFLDPSPEVQDHVRELAPARSGRPRSRSC